MATVLVNPPPNPQPTSVEIVTGPQDRPEQDRIVLLPRGSRPGRNGYEVSYVGVRNHENFVVRFWLSAEDYRTFLEGAAALAGLKVVEP